MSFQAHSLNFQLNRIQDIEPTTGDAFSASVALSDTEVFIGAPNYDYFKTERYGVVHVFRKNRVGEWKIVQTITSSTSERANLFFGRSIFVHGGELFISSGRDVEMFGLARQSAGSVECYVKGKDGLWAHTQSVVAPDAQNNDQFGDPMVSDGEWLAVGAPRHDLDVNQQDFKADAGAVYMHHKEDTGWVFHRKLTSGLRSQTMRFGSPLNLHNGRLLVGTFFDRVFDMQFDGFTWKYHKHYDPTKPPQKSFGNSIVQVR